jgi:hypothetical protein
MNVANSAQLRPFEESNADERGFGGVIIEFGSVGDGF